MQEDDTFLMGELEQRFFQRRNRDGSNLRAGLGRGFLGRRLFKNICDEEFPVYLKMVSHVTQD